MSPSVLERPSTRTRAPIDEAALSERQAPKKILVEVEGVLPAWLPPTVESLQKLLDLPRGWNSYDARQIDPNAAIDTIELLVEVMGGDTPAPSVVPTSRGSVQLEWHTRGMDIEVSIGPRGHASMWWEDLRTGEEGEEDSVRRRLLASLLARLSGRA